MRKLYIVNVVSTLVFLSGFQAMSRPAPKAGSDVAQYRAESDIDDANRRMQKKKRNQRASDDTAEQANEKLKKEKPLAGPIPTMDAGKLATAGNATGLLNKGVVAAANPKKKTVEILVNGGALWRAVTNSNQGGSLPEKIAHIVYHGNDLPSEVLRYFLARSLERNKDALQKYFEYLELVAKQGGELVAKRGGELVAKQEEELRETYILVLAKGQPVGFFLRFGAKEKLESMKKQAGQESAELIQRAQDTLRNQEAMLNQHETERIAIEENKRKVETARSGCITGSAANKKKAIDNLKDIIAGLMPNNAAAKIDAYLKDAEKRLEEIKQEVEKTKAQIDDLNKRIEGIKEAAGSNEEKMKILSEIAE